MLRQQCDIDEADLLLAFMDIDAADRRAVLLDDEPFSARIIGLIVTVLRLVLLGEERLLDLLGPAGRFELLGAGLSVKRIGEGEVAFRHGPIVEAKSGGTARWWRHRNASLS